MSNVGVSSWIGHTSWDHRCRLRMSWLLQSAKRRWIAHWNLGMDVCFCFSMYWYDEVLE